MRYQLPDGSSIEVSLDDYLSMSDCEFNSRVMCKKYYSSLEVFEPIRRNDGDIVVEKTTAQIIREIPEEDI